MMIIVRMLVQIVFGLLMVTGFSGCASQRPPARIQSAIHSINKYLSEYVGEANQALVQVDHHDQERLVGIGVLLVDVIQSLDDWAAGDNKKSKGDQQ